MRGLLFSQKVENYRREMVRTNRRNDKEFRYERVTFDDDSDDDDRSALTREGLRYRAFVPSLKGQQTLLIYSTEECRFSRKELHETRLSAPSSPHAMFYP